MEARLAAQQAKYKAGITNAPERRLAHATQIRKDHRAAVLQSKRRRPEEPDAGDATTVEQLAAALVAVAQRPSTERAAAFTLIRRALSVADEAELQARIQRCLDADIIRCCAVALTGSPSMDERLECVWVFTSIAMGSHAQTMAVLPVVPLLATCMAGDSVALAEHASWTIGNLAADSTETRAALQRQDVIAPLVACMRSRDRRLAKTAAWACGNVIRGAKGPALPAAAEIGDVALRALATAPLASGGAAAAITALTPLGGGGSAGDALGFELATEMAWVLSMVTAGDEDVCTPLVAAGAFGAAVRGLSCGHVPLATPCLRVLGNLMGLQLSFLDEALAQPALLPTLNAIIAPLMQGDGAGGGGGGDMPDGDDDDSAFASTGPPPAVAAALNGTSSHALRPRYRIGHVKEALWVVSNLLGGSAAHTAVVLLSPAWQWSPAVPPDSHLPLPLAHMLAYHMRYSPWPVRIEAAMCFANLCMQRAAIVIDPVTTALPASQLSAHPFLAVTLYFDGVLREFLAMLQAVDVATVRMALSVIDIVLHVWRASPAAAAALLERVPPLPLDPRLAAVLLQAGPDRSGPRLVQDAGGIDALEQLEFRFVDCSQAGTQAASHLSEWAHRLVEEFYGADADMDDDGGGPELGAGTSSGGGGLLGPGSGTSFAIDDDSSGFSRIGGPAGFAFGAPAGTSGASHFSAAASLPPGAGRGASAVLPAWMKPA